MSGVPEPATQSCNTGEWVSFLDRCQLTITWMSNTKVNICYSPAGGSVLRETVPEVLSTSDRGHSFSKYGPT